MRFTIILTLLALATNAFSQEFEVSPGVQADKGYRYLNEPFPTGIKLYKLDKTQIELKLVGPTLVQVWTMRAGSQPDLWLRVQQMAENWKPLGLNTVSINFENGRDFNFQRQALQEFFTRVPEPENSYFDFLGYSVDFLKVPGFPTYYLVDQHGTILFRTNGLDPKGMDLLEAEIEALLTQ